MKWLDKLLPYLDRNALFRGRWGYVVHDKQEWARLVESELEPALRDLWADAKMKGWLRPQGIYVTTICPGWVRTPMTAGLTIPANELLPVERAARLIVEAVRRKEPFCAFPPTAVRRLRLLQWLPCRVSDAIVARILRLYSRT